MYLISLLNIYPAHHVHVHNKANTQRGISLTRIKLNLNMDELSFAQ